ncbi:hypothetical protein RGV59_00200 [Pseudomonas sp. FG1]|uniref:hypothetical protein n=1 Tax=Pseudomonas sp. FG1 TaxID=3048624 RepID=UPI002AB34BD0|nr:hypothetical protein [Pseudomonas sp. FG1]MDY7549282.1 hypothetical protein [Pseudomonas sp. FG1]
MLAKNVNDNACILDERGVFEFFASKLAPTGVWVYVCGGLFEGGGWAEEFVAALFFGDAQGLEVAINTPLVGASLLAKNVNDNACILDERGVFEFFASKLAPTGVWVYGCGGGYSRAGRAEEFVAALFFGYAHGLEVALNTPLVGASLLAKNVNDNACILDERGVFEFFASKLAPTGVWVCVGGLFEGGGWAEEFVAALFFGDAQGLEVAFNTPLVGASLLAKNVNDNACILDERGVFEFFASKLAPTGVCVGGVIRGRRPGRRIRSGFVFRVRPRP